VHVAAENLCTSCGWKKYLEKLEKTFAKPLVPVGETALELSHAKNDRRDDGDTPSGDRPGNWTVTGRTPEASRKIGAYAENDGSRKLRPPSAGDG
jgi:hypothetical protein